MRLLLFGRFEAVLDCGRGLFCEATHDLSRSLKKETRPPETRRARPRRNALKDRRSSGGL